MTKKHEDQIKEKKDAALEKQEQEVEEWKGKYMRALADYQNLERRTRDEKQEARQFASEMLLTRLFPVIDTFERAAAHLGDTGLNLALKQLYAVIVEQGVEKMDVVGKPFNPHEMECIEVVDGDDDVVVSEVQPGYTLHGRVLRVAQVKVGKKSN